MQGVIELKVAQEAIDDRHRQPSVCGMDAEGAMPPSASLDRADAIQLILAWVDWDGWNYGIRISGPGHYC